MARPPRLEFPGVVYQVTYPVKVLTPRGVFLPETFTGYVTLD